MKILIRHYKNLFYCKPRINTLEKTPADGVCGEHALRICLRNKGIEVTMGEIFIKIIIPNIKSGYYMTDYDLPYRANEYDKDFIKISKINNN